MMNTKLNIIGLTSIFTILFISGSFDYKIKQPMDYYRPYVISELESTIYYLTKINNNQTNLPTLQKYYHQSRKHYKHIECFIEYCSPQEAKYAINGTLVPKNDPEFGNQIIYPKGFQVIEENLFKVEVLDTLLIKHEVNELIQQLEKLKLYYSTLQLETEELLEIFQYELYRISALSLNGYDATITLSNLSEVRSNLEGLEELVRSFKMYSESVNYYPLLKHLIIAQKCINGSVNYNNFNRLDFITEHIIPLNVKMVRFHNEIKLPWTSTKKALKLNVENLFSSNAFNIRYFSIYYGDTNSLKEKQGLGRKLFFDPNLSENKKISCSTCHSPALAFTDGLRKSIQIDKKNELIHNTPTLLNGVFQQSFFYDGRVYQLEQQIFEVIHSKEEMNGNINHIVEYLRANDEYKLLFKNAFLGTTDTNITGYATLLAIAEYERTLISLNSNFDQYLAGKKNKLTYREVNGYNLFSGKALCGSCHFFPLFNGTVPPGFNDSEFEVIGTSSTPENVNLDSNLGRYRITHIDIHKFSFKTPTLRNIALTAPYMHNGAYATLDEVIEFYHKGGGNGFGYNIINQTLPFDSLQLSKSEKEDIVLFLQTLTDTTSYK